MEWSVYIEGVLKETNQWPSLVKGAIINMMDGDKEYAIQTCQRILAASQEKNIDELYDAASELNDMLPFSFEVCV